MGGFDGAETFDLVGLYLLSEMSELPINAGHSAAQDIIFNI